jgi:ABC-type nitrate/sulfonate/bicarbonate transport system permease component
MAAPPVVPTRAPGAAKRAGLRRIVDPSMLLLIAALLGIWALVSRFTPAYALPSIPSVVEQLGRILSSRESLQGLLTTLARVAAGLASAFLAGGALGVLMGMHATVSRLLLPPVRFVQGIPSLSWVIIAVIWFADVELRVWFVMVLVTLPGFALQAYDSYRAIPADLRDMARSLRPGRWSMFREITLPAITPGIFTAWKVNLGLGIRMVLIAELVGATVGVGAELLSAQQLFDMSAVISWTLLLAFCMLLLQAVIELIESRVLRYRPAITGQRRARATAPTAKG